MCIVFLWKQEASELIGKFKFILAANRDEFFYRPAKEAHYWNNHPHVLAGQDLTKSLPDGFGTWLGVTKHGKISYLTNIPSFGTTTNIYANTLKGRGELVANFLRYDKNALSYMTSLQEDKQSYGTFNLICGNVNGELYYTRNVLDDTEDSFSTVERGFTCLTNDVLGCKWKMSVNGLNKFSGILRDYSSEENIHDQLLNLLRDSTSYHPDPAMPGGDSYSSYRANVFIPLQESQFGTRTHTIVTVDVDDNLTFLERTKTELNQLPTLWTQNIFKFKIEAS